MSLKLSTEQIADLIFKSSGETAFMVGWALFFSIIFGVLLGLFLYLTSSQYFFKNHLLNSTIGFIVNAIRSVPFLILLVTLLPLGQLFVKTTIGPKAVIFPLAVAAVAFYARLSENAFNEVDKGVIEASVASGAKPSHIVTGILFPEALPQLVRHLTVTTISLISYSAMAGIVGGGGIGDLAIRYGYQRYSAQILIICIILLVAIVQVVQWIGDIIAGTISRK